MGEGTDRIRLGCRFCAGSEWDLWGTLRDGGGFDPEDGLDGMRCPSCLVLSDQVLEVNGEEVAASG